jgi:hypothetical protein
MEILIYTGSNPNLKLKKPEEPDYKMNLMIHCVSRSYCRVLLLFKFTFFLKKIFSLQLFLTKHQSLIWRLQG